MNPKLRKFIAFTISIDLRDWSPLAMLPWQWRSAIASWVVILFGVLALRAVGVKGFQQIALVFLGLFVVAAISFLVWLLLAQQVELDSQPRFDTTRRTVRVGNKMIPYSDVEVRTSHYGLSDYDFYGKPIRTMTYEVYLKTSHGERYTLSQFSNEQAAESYADRQRSKLNK